MDLKHGHLIGWIELGEDDDRKKDRREKEAWENSNAMDSPY